MVGLGCMNPGKMDMFRNSIWPSVNEWIEVSDMNCPGCKIGKLIPSYIDELFRAHTCPECGGNWLLIEDYIAWKERCPEHAFDKETAIEYEDSAKALICPVSGVVMQKYRVSHDTGHRLDYSPRVGGVWLDKGEWEYLKAKGIAGGLNKVFTSQWQKALRDKSTQLSFADIYREKFGEEAYAKVKEIREWLNRHPQKADLRAYLLAENPYSAE